MAARSAKGDARLAALVRERQDLVEEWQLPSSSSVKVPRDNRDR